MRAQRVQKAPRVRRRKSLLSQLINSLTYKGTMDMELIVLILIMVLFGLIMVASASSYTALRRHGDSLLFFRKQLIVALLGFAVMLAASKVDYHILASPRVLTPMLMGIWLIMLLTAFFGEDYNGAKRWINIAGFSIQPSELAKIGWVLLFAMVCSKQKPKELHDFKTSWLRYGILMAIVAFPLILQPHKSAIALIGVVCFIIAMVAGANLKYIFIAMPVGLLAFIVLAFTSEYSRARIMNFWNPFLDARGSGWQAVQSLYAIGSGGFFGRGLGKSIQKTNIPEPHCDFIFPIICEELGFLGGALVILLFFLFLVRCIKIAMEAPDKLGSLICIGIATLILVQMVINVAVVTALMPVTGMQLPFFSAGGTSLLFTLGAMGIVLNVSRQGKKNGAVRLENAKQK